MKKAIIINDVEVSNIDVACHNCIYSKAEIDGHETVYRCRLEDNGDSKGICKHWSISIEKWKQLNQQVKIIKN